MRPGHTGGLDIRCQVAPRRAWLRFSRRLRPTPIYDQKANPLGHRSYASKNPNYGLAEWLRAHIPDEPEFLGRVFEKSRLYIVSAMYRSGH